MAGCMHHWGMCNNSNKQHKKSCLLYWVCACKELLKYFTAHSKNVYLSRTCGDGDLALWGSTSENKWNVYKNSSNIATHSYMDKVSLGHIELAIADCCQWGSLSLFKASAFLLLWCCLPNVPWPFVMHPQSELHSHDPLQALQLGPKH